jgi:resuscitation-promoting factor RpfB
MRTENWQSDTPGLRLVGEEESGSVLSPYGPVKAGLTTSHRTQLAQLSVLLAKRYASAFGWRGGEWECLESLWTRESRFDHFAQNPTSSAFGIAQLLGERSRDPALQVLRGLRYIDRRYGTPCKAYKFSLTHRYY